ncbi:CDP-alcohol phosphatidyltransferase family protein [Halomonas sp. ML-15]|uniref:CDP-alcohol phosphatidyltransferase family protein n=1 Tax=Halomonas sp. ML-15 TaxID=2773305 RepID=UPI001746A15C|nr:CDP-alcohol phosphatidyltransferase family protein [Halomonas sp. ML-15]MBD3898292.1 CDP-alcohol phosphatidyltransferase family protein [Halomonas sp. ML-15]
MSRILSPSATVQRPFADLAAGLAVVLVLAQLAQHALTAPGWLALTSGLSYLIIAGLVAAAWTGELRRFGWANRVTLLRGTLIALLAGSLWWPALWQQHAVALAAIAGAALLLDGIDGWVARRTGSSSAFGARFDMELDASFILLLCLALVVLGKVGSWVLLIGAMRYVFVVSGHLWPWLRAPLPESLRRKAVCVVQVVALMIALLPAVSAAQASLLTALALLLLSLSFALDVHWLAGKPAAK